MKKYVIFDIDGTINKTENYVYKSYLEAFEKYGINNITKSEIQSFIGCTPNQIQELYFSDKDEEFLRRWYVDVEKFEKKYMDMYAEAFPGVLESLTKLKEEGYSLAVCSNADKEHILNVLNAIKLIDFFDDICHTVDNLEKKDILKIFLEKIGADKVCMVGDRKFDIEAARHNNIPFIGCGYGYAPKEIENADIVIDDAFSIYNAVRDLL